MSQSERINKLVFEGTPEAFEYLQKLWKSGNLNDLLHISVINVSVVSPSQFNVWENLSQWFDNIFGESWQPAIAYGFRKTYSQEITPVTRSKVIYLEEQSVTLVVSLKRLNQQQTDILVRIEPTVHQTYLPEQIRLMVMDESENIVLETQSKSRDNCLQQQFQCTADTKFSIKVILGDISITEYFVIESEGKEKLYRELNQKYEQELESFEENYQTIMENKNQIIVTEIQQNFIQLSEWFDGWITGGWQIEKSLNQVTIKDDTGILCCEDLVTELPEIRATKIIKLGMQELSLGVKQKQITKDKIDIFLQLSPVSDPIYLPDGVRLIVLDESGESITNLNAQANADNLLQLHFSGSVGDKFSVRVTLGDETFTENFVI